MAHDPAYLTLVWQEPDGQRLGHRYGACPLQGCGVLRAPCPQEAVRRARTHRAPRSDHRVARRPAATPLAGGPVQPTARLGPCGSSDLHCGVQPTGAPTPLVVRSQRPTRATDLCQSHRLRAAARSAGEADLAHPRYNVRLTLSNTALGQYRDDAVQNSRGDAARARTAGHALRLREWWQRRRECRHQVTAANPRQARANHAGVCLGGLCRAGRVCFGLAPDRAGSGGPDRLGRRRQRARRLGAVAGLGREITHLAPTVGGMRVPLWV